MSPERPDPPPYKVYRSRRPLLGRRSSKAGLPGADGDGRKDRGRDPRLPGSRSRLRPGRLLRWILIAAFAWMALSLVLFLVSAQIHQNDSPELEEVLNDDGSMITGSNVLVLGSDQRPPDSQEPGAQGAAARADSILLLHATFGEVRRLSILRDSLADVPGQGPQKINAAYAFGGAPLTVQTVEDFLGNGIGVNHVVEVSFEDFPRFVDALGGVTVDLERCVVSEPFGGRVFRLRRGSHELNGRQALAYARIRKNRCSQNEDDRARARRQQEVLAAIRSQILSPETFLRLPLVAWQAPRTLRTDMAGPGLFGLFVDIMTGGSGSSRILRPVADGPNSSLIVSEEEKERAVRRLEGTRDR